MQPEEHSAAESRKGKLLGAPLQLEERSAAESRKGKLLGAPLLTANRVTVAYGRNHPVLRDVSVLAKPGRILAVTGASGAGKTTLLWTLAGLLTPLTGEVSSTGRVVLIPQHNGLAPVLTAAENIQIALLEAGMKDAQRLAGEALAQVGLDGQAGQLAEELSGGQQQRAAIARGMALRGDVLLADEVTSELDATNRELVLKLLRGEAERGATVVFATHDPQAAAACDDQLHLVDGYVSSPR